MVVATCSSKFLVLWLIYIAGKSICIYDIYAVTPSGGVSCHNRGQRRYQYFRTVFPLKKRKHSSTVVSSHLSHKPVYEIAHASKKAIMIASQYPSTSSSDKTEVAAKKRSSRTQTKKQISGSARSRHCPVLRAKNLRHTRSCYHDRYAQQGKF